MTEVAPQRVYPLREIFNALRYQVKTGGVWRMMPHDLPPWNIVYQQHFCLVTARGFDYIGVCKCLGSELCGRVGEHRT